MIRTFKRVIVFFAVTLSCVASSGAGEARFPQIEGYVNDYAKILSSSNKNQMEALLKEVENKAGVQIAVVTVKTTAPLTIEQYAVELFQKWGIGKKGEDKGILMLLSVDDKKIRIEVGYGLEGVVTDIKSKVIIDTLMVPHFKAGNYEEGIFAGVAMLAKMMEEEYKVEYDLSGVQSVKPQASKDELLSGLLTLILFILIFGFRFGTLFFFASSGSRGRYWSSGSGGSFGGGFGGFGGGMSGGGGSSGSW